MLFGIYASVLAAVVVAGFLDGAIGIWASILWGVGVLVGLASTSAGASSGGA
jgi:hypothetical protein